MNRSAIKVAPVTDQVAYRYTWHDLPFWAVEAGQPAGRWHVQGEGPAQYMSLSAEGAWAELIRREDLRTEVEVSNVSVTLWQARVTQVKVADLSDFARSAAADIDAGVLVDDDYEGCQEIGRKLREWRFRGVMSPSAALPGSLNLTIFGPRYATEYQRPAPLASAIPASVVTIGAPPPGLIDRVRYRAEPHPAVEEARNTKTKKQS